MRFLSVRPHCRHIRCIARPSSTADRRLNVQHIFVSTSIAPGRTTHILLLSDHPKTLCLALTLIPSNSLSRRDGLPDNLLRLGLQHRAPIVLDLNVGRVDLVPLLVLERAEPSQAPSIEHRLVLVPSGTRGREHLFAGKDGVLGKFGRGRT